MIFINNIIWLKYYIIDEYISIIHSFLFLLNIYIIILLFFYLCDFMIRNISFHSLIINGLTARIRNKIEISF